MYVENLFSTFLSEVVEDSPITGMRSQSGAWKCRVTCLRVFFVTLNKRALACFRHSVQINCIGVFPIQIIENRHSHRYASVGRLLGECMCEYEWRRSATTAFDTLYAENLHWGFCYQILGNRLVAGIPLARRMTLLPVCFPHSLCRKRILRFLHPHHRKQTPPGYPSVRHRFGW